MQITVQTLQQLKIEYKTFATKMNTLIEKLMYDLMY